VRKEAFPENFTKCLEYARDFGAKLVVFDTQEECARERLRFYRFRAAVRADAAHPLHEAESRCTVQWIAVPPTKYRRALRICVAQTQNDPWSSEADEKVKHDIEVEEWLRNNRQK
jgi:hypothetical protein